MNREIAEKLLTHVIDPDALYDQAPCGYLTFAPEGTIIKINQTLLKWLDHTEEEVLYIKKFGDFLSKGGQIHYEMFFRPMLNVSGSVKELSYELKTKHGAFHVLFGAVAIKNKQGHVIAVNAILTDNTDRKRYEQELLVARNQAEKDKRNMQFLADLTPDLIWTTTPDGEIDYINARFADYFQVAGRNFTQEQFLERIHEDDRIGFKTAWAEKLKCGDPLSYDLRLENHNGEYRWHLVKSVPHYTDQREILKWFGSCTDINDHKLALTKKDEFISVASHELKTPLTTLMGILQVLDRIKSKPATPMLSEFIDRANKNAKKINSLVGELLNVGQLTAGQLRINKEWFNLYELIDNCCQYVRTEDVFEIEVKGDHELQVYADAGRIEQVLINYINNAVKYAPNSGLLTIGFKVHNEEIKVSVTDKGPGIQAEKIPHLFDRFYRIDTGGSQYAGLGLGLYICAEIVKKHGGRVGANSVLGKGSSFWFTLPIKEL
ncbi:PAS domain-containing sensor histidine kinase [Mucilaginibacter sp. 10I4]|uniref:PAS domain-containing sensor histidine kinase n=1 Tax=Mucilaginibacter sp. 10I4 TaxID=3048580 RepID=UPI002B22F9A3|nr:PAS domain-containing sensor histidine kinase [Mucilaginibacter sp. 10I4]MEB0261787.1 PAS domain-containing sensor histidine kinase [Mucilaginibacter sp. 10I4]